MTKPNAGQLIVMQVIHRRMVAVDWAVAKSQYQAAGAL
jgi:hypothetical protein